MSSLALFYAENIFILFIFLWGMVVTCVVILNIISGDTFVSNCKFHIVIRLLISGEVSISVEGLYIQACVCVSICG